MLLLTSISKHSRLYNLAGNKSQVTKASGFIACDDVDSGFSDSFLVSNRGSFSEFSTRFLHEQDSGQQFLCELQSSG